MGIFDIFKRKKNDVVKEDLTVLVESILVRTFVCEWYISLYPIKEQYNELLGVVHSTDDEDLEDSSIFAQWVDLAININDWSEVKKNLRESIDGSAKVCIEMPTELIKVIAADNDSEIFKRFLLSENQLDSGKKHISNMILTPLTDNVYPVLNQLHSSQRALKQGYAKFHNEHTSIWRPLKPFADGAVSGLMMISGNPLAMLAGGARFAKKVSEDAPEAKYLNSLDNYFELADEYNKHAEIAGELGFDKLEDLLEKQATPLVEKYIDTALSNDVMTIEQCHKKLSALEKRNFQHYLTTVACEMAQHLENGE